MSRSALAPTPREAETGGAQIRSLRWTPWLACLLLAAITCSPAATPSPTPTSLPLPSATIRSVSLHLELAATPQQVALGLGERDALPQDRGMLFIYPTPTLAVFWMKGMRFPIDILWVSPQGRLIGIVHDAQPQPGGPDNALALYHAPSPVSYVLEINAGLARKYGFAAGDEVQFLGAMASGEAQR